MHFFLIVSVFYMSVGDLRIKNFNDLFVGPIFFLFMQFQENLAK